jgi:hypothetical protein
VERGGPSIGKVGEWCVESRHLQDCSPHLCRLRTYGLAPTSKYWMCQSHAGVYEPNKHSNWLPTDVWLCHHCFNGWLRRETGYRTTDRSAGVLWIMSGTPFLRSSGPAQLCCWLCKRLLYVDHVRHVWSMDIRGLSMENVWRVGRVFPCRVYIDSNHRDSRIWVSLVCGSHHVDNLMSLSVIDVCYLIHLIICNSCMIGVGCTFLLK